jgi:hypothetical protein
MKQNCILRLPFPSAPPVGAPMVTPLPASVSDGDEKFPVTCMDPTVKIPDTIGFVRVGWHRVPLFASALAPKYACHCDESEPKTFPLGCENCGSEFGGHVCACANPAASSSAVEHIRRKRIIAG